MSYRFNTIAQKYDDHDLGENGFFFNETLFYFHIKIFPFGGNHRVRKHYSLLVYCTRRVLAVRYPRNDVWSRKRTFRRHIFNDSSSRRSSLPPTTFRLESPKISARLRHHSRYEQIMNVPCNL